MSGLCACCVPGQHVAAFSPSPVGVDSEWALGHLFLSEHLRHPGSPTLLISTGLDYLPGGLAPHTITLGHGVAGAP